MKHVKKALALALAIGLLGAGAALADNQDSITIRMSPPTDYAISLSTDDFNFGEVELAETYLSTDTTITVTNTGSVSADWGIAGQNSAEGWELGETPDEDTIRLRVMLSSTTTPESDIEGASWGEDDSVIIAEVTRALDKSFDTEHNEYNGLNVGADGERRIWFQLETPTQTTVTEEQDFSVTVEAFAVEHAF